MDTKGFEAQVLGLVNLNEPFKPSATYDRDGDCIEFFGSAEDYLAERIDGLVTVYRGRESKNIIGSLIKGVSKLIRENLGVRIVVRDGKVCSVMFLRGAKTS